VDAAKTCAIAGVLLIHASAVGGFSAPVGSGSWCAALFWGSVLRCAVPVFFLCSGALLLNPEKDVSPRRVWTHYIPHILAALFFWAAAYGGWALLLGWHRTGVLEAAAIRRTLLDLVLFHHKSHLYYLHIVLLVYALLPVTRAFTARATRAQLRYFLLAWLALGVALPTLRAFPPFSQMTGIPAQWPMNMTYASVGYTAAGWAVRKYGAHRRPREYALLYLVGFVFTYSGTLWMSARQGELYGGFLSGMAPGICAEAVGLYGWCTAYFRDAPEKRGLAAVSRASFCIYLTHLFFLDFLAGRGLTAAAFAPAVSVPLIAAALFACGFAVWLAARRIPWVNRWLI
jgi:surface polysaccharide O-acyltransferase-like enzyme